MEPSDSTQQPNDMVRERNERLAGQAAPGILQHHTHCSCSTRKKKWLQQRLIGAAASSQWGAGRQADLVRMERDRDEGSGVEELLRRARTCLARAALTRDPERKAALLEKAAMLEGLAARARAGERL